MFSLNLKRKEVKKEEKEGFHPHRASGRHSYYRYSGRDSLSRLLTGERDG
jgi:hypothetical protein